MTDEEKLAIFERADITDEFIDETNRMVESREFFEGTWTTVETQDPVVARIKMDPAAPVSLVRNYLTPA